MIIIQQCVKKYFICLHKALLKERPANEVIMALCSTLSSRIEYTRMLIEYEPIQQTRKMCEILSDI